MSSISAGTSAGTALVSTGDTTGALQLQVNGTTPSVTLAANGSIGVGSTPGYGTAGQVLQSNGSSAAPSWVAAGGGFSQAQIFTASGSFTVPASGKFKVTIIGGGGSGGGINSTTSAGGSGGSAGNVIKWFTGATPSATATVTIGAGGTAVTNTNGNTGGNSSFVLSGFTTLTASGGVFGLRSNTGGDGGAATGGDINITGQRGGNTVGDVSGNFWTTFVTLGGGTLLGFGGCKFGSGNSDGVNATGYGSGGTGACANTNSGVGGGGICIVEY